MAATSTPPRAPWWANGAHANRPCPVTAAIPAVLLGVGFPLNALKGVPMLARCAGLIAHMSEELETPIGFALSYQATREERYTGPVPAGFVPVQKID
jgi:citrate synthase